MASSSHQDGDWMDQYAQLQIEEEEEGALITDDQEGDVKAFDDWWCLVRKYLTNRTIDFDALRHMLASLWQHGKGVYIKELDTNRYFFQFYLELDVQAIIDGSPWTFNRMQLVFHRLKRGEDPRLVQLHELDMWFDPHFDQDIKPYGQWMKAITKKKNYLIGAQWLRSSCEEDDGSAVGSGRHRNNKRRRTDKEIMKESVDLGDSNMGRMENSDATSKNDLQDLVIQKHPKVVFFCETLSKAEVLEKIRVALDFEGVNFIDVSISGNNGKQWHLTGLYGEPNRSLRKNTWDQIRVLKNKSSLPWCVVGDLNNVTSQSDKRGGNPYPNWLIEGFGNMLEECSLCDMDLCGYPYMWEKEVSTSHHCPIQLVLDVEKRTVSQKQFRFENLWLREPACLHLVKDTWELFLGFSVIEKIIYCGEKLLVWGKDYLGNFRERIQACKTEMRRWKEGKDAASVE
uniref:DUF4283 domain-containing protein n=1 Tax=Cannabis sativa TaxID=3483 RepID=A0A803P4P8_CANSA